MASRKRARGTSNCCCKYEATKTYIKEHMASLCRNPIDFIGFAKPIPVYGVPSKMSSMVRDINLEFHRVEHRDQSHEGKKLDTAWRVVKPVAPKANFVEKSMGLIRNPFNLIRGSKSFTEDAVPMVTASEIRGIHIEMH